jgi:hypothetical protein
VTQSPGGWLCEGLRKSKAGRAAIVSCRSVLFWPATHTKQQYRTFTQPPTNHRGFSKCGVDGLAELQAPGQRPSGVPWLRSSRSFRCLVRQQAPPGSPDMQTNPTTGQQRHKSISCGANIPAYAGKPSRRNAFMHAKANPRFSPRPVGLVWLPRERNQGIQSTSPGFDVDLHSAAV